MCDGKNCFLVRKLFNAVIRNDAKEVVDLVRNQGIDVDSRDARRSYLHQTALHKAAKKGYLDMVRVLVEDLGADINIDDISGFSPIQRAIQYGKANVAKYLAAKQCDDADEYYDWKNTSTLEIDDQNFDVNIFRDELESESE